MGSALEQVKSSVFSCGVDQDLGASLGRDPNCRGISLMAYPVRAETMDPAIVMRREPA